MSRLIQNYFFENLIFHCGFYTSELDHTTRAGSINSPQNTDKCYYFRLSRKLFGFHLWQLIIRYFIYVNHLYGKPCGLDKQHFHFVELVGEFDGSKGSGSSGPFDVNGTPFLYLAFLHFGIPFSVITNSWAFTFPSSHTLPRKVLLPLVGCTPWRSQ